MLNKQTSPEQLANLLGTTLGKLNYRIYGLPLISQYITFDIPKKSGGFRTIKAPDDSLKILQDRLKSLLESLYVPSRSVSAFVQGRGVIYNAQWHLKRKNVINIDIENFYDQIHFGRILGMLIAKPYSLRYETARIIAHISCVDGVIPQGAPTSPIVSNMICRRLDREFVKFSSLARVFYTRYADDITFSFNHNELGVLFNKNENKVSSEIERIVLSNGFRINVKKTRLQSSKERQVVTGIKVNSKLNIDRRYYRTTKSMIHSMKINIEAAQKKFLKLNPESKSDIVNVVRGRISYISMVKGKSSSEFLLLAQKFNELKIPDKISTATNSISPSIDDRLNFRVMKQQEWLKGSVLAIDFEGIDGLEVSEQLVQATAFVIQGPRIITANHVFSKAGGAEECFLYRIDEPSNKYRAKLYRRNVNADLAELVLNTDIAMTFSPLNLAPNFNHGLGYKVSVVGHPQLNLTQRYVNVLPCMITNHYIKSTFHHYEVNAAIKSGNSGGPVLNAHMQVLGVALMGESASYDAETETIELEGKNVFVSGQYLDFDLNGWEVVE